MTRKRQPTAQARTPAESSAWRTDHAQGLPHLNANPSWIPQTVDVAGIRAMYVMTHSNPEQAAASLADVTDPVHVLAVVAPHVLAKYAAGRPQAQQGAPGTSIVDELARDADLDGNHALARLLRGLPSA